MASISSPILLYPFMITSILIDMGISKVICGGDTPQAIEFPFQCRETSAQTWGFSFLQPLHGISSFVSSCMIVALVPMVLGLGPFGSSMAVSSFIVVWSVIVPIVFYLIGKNQYG
jgi:hypothetical protein